MNQACPVRLVNIISNYDAKSEFIGRENIALVEKGLEYLSKQESPVYIVPVLGAYRGGKSLLLNRIMGLSAPYKGGFGVGHGQNTHTKGVDVCAEKIDGLGTVIWMDTEGLWSSDDSFGLYGPKIFCLSLLFSSMVLLNSVKVLNVQFFEFFAEQQQVARIIRQGLQSEGFPDDTLLPPNLSVLWILQQPLEYNKNCTSKDATVVTTCRSKTQDQLNKFLRGHGDELRERVRHDFRHHLHEVPMAVHDFRLWSHLDQVTDENLIPDYVESARYLRFAVLKDLQTSRPLQARSIAIQLRLYVDLVTTNRFHGQLAKELFEEKEMGIVCNSFEREVSDLVGILPAPTLKLQNAFAEARRVIEPLFVSAVETYHFGEGWTRRLEQCLKKGEREIGTRNSETVLEQWRMAIDTMSEEKDCFFLDRVFKLRQAYEISYDEYFDEGVQEKANIYARSLQRTRLIECVKIRGFFWPLTSWIIWPFCSLYMLGGTRASLGTMMIHASLFFVVYVSLQFFAKLPDFFDLSYPILRKI